MAEKKTLKERRTESDTKIIASAINCFAHNGYSNASLSDIAKGAGITAGLISQRFATKEHLFIAAFQKILSAYFTDVDESKTPRECFIHQLNLIKKMSEEDKDSFNFCLMLHNNPDIPSALNDEFKSHIMRNTTMFRILSDAMETGILPKVELEILLFSFSSNAFHLIGLCNRFHASLPEDSFFLQIINFSDEEIGKLNMRIKDQMVDIFCKDFQAVWLIKLSDLSMEIFRTDEKVAIPGSVNTALEINSYDKARKWYVQNYVRESSRERVLRQSDINNVLSELENGGTYHIEYGRVMNGEVNYNQLYYDKITNRDTGDIEYILFGFRNIDVAKKAEFDDLTGVLIRPVFFREAERLLKECPEKQFDIVISDIMDFKKINEIYGSSVADSILKWHGEYLSTLTNDNLIVGRYGGDQMVLFGLHEDVERCLSPAYRERFEDARRNNGLPSVTFKYGIYQNVKHERSILSSCDKAHMALNSIKRHYSREIAYYDNTIRMQMEKKRTIEESMHASLKNGDFKVYYQPKHDAKTKKLVGAEALIRWIHPTYGFMSPADFIPLFEQNGFVAEVDGYVGMRTCENLRRWMDQGISTVPISINVSKLTMTRSDLLESIQNNILQYRLSPNQLHMEITETLMTENKEELITKLNQIRDLGCKVELDDFGSGYSSLNILSTFPIDILKLDMSFLQNFGDEKSKIVLESCIEMAKKMGFVTVSEGVETKEQNELLGDLGVDTIQGYYYSKPLSESDFEQYMIEHSND